MTEPYREPTPPTRAEFDELRERVDKIALKPPRPPFRWRLLHTLVIGLVMPLLTIPVWGWFADAVPQPEYAGRRIAAYVVLGFITGVGLLIAIASLAALESRNGLRSYWSSGE